MIVDSDGVVVSTYGRFLRTRYNYDMDEASRKSGFASTEETMTKQSFKEECDINTIVRNFGVTGELPNNIRMPLSAEFVETMDYQGALNQLMEAQKSFMMLSSDVRARFENDPAKFIAFAENPANLEECRKMGLAPAAKAAPEPQLVKVVPEGATG